jgi:hypothetical protein
MEEYLNLLYQIDCLNDLLQTCDSIARSKRLSDKRNELKIKRDLVKPFKGHNFNSILSMFSGKLRAKNGLKSHKDIYNEANTLYHILIQHSTSSRINKSDHFILHDIHCLNIGSEPELLVDLIFAMHIINPDLLQYNMATTASHVSPNESVLAAYDLVDFQKANKINL